MMGDGWMMEEGWAVKTSTVQDVPGNRLVLNVI